jgi:CTP:molybdopterin cytidylyltransferase MocA
MNNFEIRRPAAIILAAGYSSRMGATKPIVLIEGTPMLVRAAQTFVNANIGHIIVVTGFDTENVSELAAAHGMHPVYNSHFSEGMFIRSAQVSARCRRISTLYLCCRSTFPLCRRAQ